MAGYSVQQIANHIGMSVQMVTRYSRFMDQKEAAENNIVVLEFAQKRGADKLKRPNGRGRRLEH
jgi:hypothetical protein